MSNSMPTTVTVADLAAEMSHGSVSLVDVRESFEFQGQHIAGAVSLPLSQLADRLDTLPPEGAVTVVCRSGARATQAAQTLRGQGREARVLEGGMLAWSAAGQPSRGGGSRLAIDRQVQLVVGPVILTSLALGTLVHPGFLGMAAIVGAGLTFAGASGTCGLALVLARAPWNQ